MNLASILKPINDSFHEATEEQIGKIEARVGKLPQDYVGFLHRYGGAMFAGDASIRSSTSKTLAVFTLYAADGERGSVLSDLQAHPDYLQAGLVPIGDDLFNNRYVLKISSGEVFFIEYRHGTSQFLHVAPSFAVFMENIEITPDETL